MKKVLVIEDDDAIRENILDLLNEEGFAATGANNGARGLDSIRRDPPDLIVCDILMPEMDGYGVLGAVRACEDTTAIPFLFLSAKASRAEVRHGMNLGADDYLTKPFSNAELLQAVQTRVARSGAVRSSNPGPPPVGPTPTKTVAATGTIIAAPSMIRLYEQVGLVAQNVIPVLLLGETGVGKEVLARAIHARSPREKRPFVAINCGALSESLLESELFGHEKGAFTGAVHERRGLFESAEGGTLFLDEIGDLAAAMQVKLLRVLQEREVVRVGGRAPIKVDVRIVAATHRDLDELVAAGTFREDLYYRIHGFPIAIPPLRERQAEILPLSQAFLQSACRAAGRARVPRISAEVEALLLEHDWPGNIRELRHAIERALVLCPVQDSSPVLTADHFDLQPRRRTPVPPSRPPLDRQSRTLQEEQSALEEQRIREALVRFGGNQTRAAEFLGISRRKLVMRLGDYELPRPRKR